MSNKKTKRKKPNPETDVILEFGLNPDDWKIRVHTGKTVFHNPSNCRSYIGVYVNHLPTGKVLESAVRGAFTKKQANDHAINLVRKLLKEMVPKINKRSH